MRVERRLPQPSELDDLPDVLRAVHLGEGELLLLPLPALPSPFSLLPGPCSLLPALPAYLPGAVGAVQGELGHPPGVEGEAGGGVEGGGGGRLNLWVSVMCQWKTFSLS